MLTWLKILFSPATIVRLLNSAIAFLEILKDNPEYGDQAREILVELKKYFSPDQA